VLLAVDEVQYLDAKELAGIISAIHRTTQLELPVVFVGAGLPQLAGLAGEAKSYSERLFDFPSVDSLPVDAAKKAIREPANAAGADIEDAALDAIVELTQGYPYFLQVWAHEAWNAAKTSPIRLVDIRSIEADVLGLLDANFFRVRYDRLKPSERRYLFALAELGSGIHRSGEIADRYGAKVDSVGLLRSNLIKKGMIYSPQHGDTAFTVPLFDQFMLRSYAP